MKEASPDRLFELFLRFNRRLTFIIAHLAPPLTLNESHTLGEIGRRGLITAREIGNNLVLEKSIVSRLLSSLEERGLISSEVSPNDRRAKHLKLTDTGRSLFERDDELRSEQVRICVAALSASEQVDLGHYLTVMADSFRASEVPFDPADHPVKTQIRRLTRAMGFLGNNLLETGLSVEECQLVYLIGENPAGIAMVDLRELVPYEASMLSRLVSVLQTAQMLSKHSPAFDRRHVHLRLTNKGVRIWGDKSALAGKKIAGSLRTQSVENLNHFVSLLEKYLDGSRLFAGLSAGSGCRVALLKRKDDLQTARSFLIEELVRSGQHHEAPEYILASRSICYGAYRDGQIKAVLELRQLSGEWRMVNFALAADAATREFATGILITGLRAVLKRRSGVRVAISKSSSAYSWLKEFSDNSTDSAGTVLMSASALERLERAARSSPV